MLKDELKHCGAAFEKGLHTEVRGQVSRSRSAALLNGNLIANSRTESSGVSARVYKGGVYGFSSIAEYSKEAAERVLKAAHDNAVFMDSHVPAGKPDIKPLGKGEYLTDVNIVDAPQKVYIDFARQIDDYVAKHCPKLISRRIMAVEDSMEKLLKVSDGTDAHTALPRSYVYAMFTAATPAGQPVELFKAFGGEGTFENNFTDPAALYSDLDRLYENILKKADGVYAEAGMKTVVLGGFMTGMLSHEAVGHTVEADLVLGGSVAGKMLGKQVASPLVTLSDFAHEAFGKRAPLPVFVDDEGTSAEDVTLIKDGILVGYMNSRQTADHFHMAPAGNARAWSFSDEPLIRMRNTAVHPGASKLEDMIASIDDGYYLIDSGNGQADTTGEFMFGVTMGYEIKNGKLGRALLDTTISGVAFEMLKTVDMVGDTVEWSSSGYCGKKQPMPVGMGGPALRCKVMIGGR
ncbi:MAG: TldD/PmbA family protein [Clostridiales bacterium]|nr:TldD/PmbA family protein [Clostridiales bacterium]